MRWGVRERGCGGVRRFTRWASSGRRAGGGRRTSGRGRNGAQGLGEVVEAVGGFEFGMLAVDVLT